MKYPNSILQKINESEKVINLCNKLNWQEYCNVILNSKGLISIETVAIHIASVKDIPTFVLFSGVSDENIWGPLNLNAVILSPAKLVTPENIFSAIEKYKIN